ncbi:MAG: hypothetical protein M1832_004772 [Thelocarpon impressellum]|nr:MAG: hypothetical protein M1832_004772 [Thelocarpon impressellum]
MSSSSDDDGVDDGNAYERVKRQLMQQHPSTNDEATTASGPTARRVLSDSDSPVGQHVKRNEISGDYSGEDGDSSGEDDDPPRARPIKKTDIAGDSLGDESVDHPIAQHVERIENSGNSSGDDCDEPLRTRHVEKNDIAGDYSGDDSDDAPSASRLTQYARPARKASKKALEEMHKETQRLSRNMQLTHEARTRSKVTKQSLFARFDYHPAGEELAGGSSVQAPVSIVSPSHDPLGDLPDIPDATTGHAATSDYTKYANVPWAETPWGRRDAAGQASRQSDHKASESNEAAGARTGLKKPTVRVRLPAIPLSNHDSDLEIVPTTKAKVALWERVGVDEKVRSAALQKLRMLANLPSANQQPGSDKGAMTRSELDFSLQRQARQQAQQEREERVKDLERRGIVVQSAEDRAKEDDDVEDLVTKAWAEADEIRKREAAATRKEEAKTGEVDAVAISDEDDDFIEDDVHMVLSGSDESGDEQDADDTVDDLESDQGSDETLDGPTLFLEEADDEEDVESGDESELEISNGKVRVTRRARLVIDQDTDDEIEEISVAPTSATRSARKIPAGLPTTDPNPLGLTQIFAGTMDEIEPSQGSDAPPFVPACGRAAWEKYCSQPSPSLLEARPPGFEGSQEVVHDSQASRGQEPPYWPDPLADMEEYYSQDNQRLELMSDRLKIVMATQVSAPPDPTQDAGFGQSSPLPSRFVEVFDSDSTEDTVLLERGGSPASSKAPSPAKAPRRLRAKAEARGASGNAEATSRAKALVEEQAEESEDEWAGLGGASDEGSGDEEDAAALEAMVDDEVDDADEGALAAFYADKERAADERGVERLLKDISRGALRRKRGAEFELSDSDSDDEARRKRRRRELARRREALLKDEDVSHLAANPKRAAFLRTIADVEEVRGGPSLKRKRGADEEGASDGDDDENRPPPHLRRARKGAKPAALTDVLSELLGAPNAGAGEAGQADSSDEEDAAAADKAHRPAAAVVDRRALLRRQASSSAASASSGAGSKLAFQDASAASSTAGFRVPALLRRATTSALAVAGTERAAGLTSATADDGAGAIKRGGAKSSSINWRAREREDRQSRRGKDESRPSRLRQGLGGRSLAGLGLGNWA